MIEASAIFKKSSFNDIESLQMAELSTMFQNIADAEISAADASSFLISQMKAFNITASDAIHIIDATNEVANNFAVGTNDLQRALQTSASSLSVLGNSFEETIGLVSAGTEIMVGQSTKVGRGLRTIGINLAAMATKTGELKGEMIGTNGEVEAFSIALNDSNGNLKSTYDIMNELYPTWGKMNEAQQTALAQAVAGKTQFD